MSESGDRPDRSLGRIESALFRLFTKPATVHEVEAIGAHFVLITLKGDALRQVAWVPGQKVQMQLHGWVLRTFTPLAWDAVEGTTSLLAYLHGDAPATRWVRSLEAGQPCMIFGPRGSLDLNVLERPALLFGDETSLGLAHALRHTPNGAGEVQVVLEVTSKQVASPVLERFGLSHAQLVERRSDDSHLGDVENLTVQLIQEQSVKSCALTGKATSIQKLNKRLRALGLAGGQVRKKAYWAPGKVGLD